MTLLTPIYPGHLDVSARNDVERRRAELLDRRAPRLVERARTAGAHITYCGITPMFSGPRAYAAHQVDWTIAPLTGSDSTVMPAQPKHNLEMLRAAGISFPVLYVAHEIDKKQLNLPIPAVGEAHTSVAITPERAAEVVGPVPLPAAELAQAERLDAAAAKVLNSLRRAMLVGGSVLAAPLLAVQKLTTLDPVVFGVIPAGPAVDGTPGAWYAIAQWDW